jgi:glutamate---cysteine ligase / carboxylate-amine ligase
MGMSASAGSRARILAGSLSDSDAWRVAVSSFSRSSVDSVDGPNHRPRGTYPLWAHWNGELDQRYTLGVEEELMLLQPDDWSLAQASDDVLAGLSDELSRRASPETHAAVLELATGIHPDVSGVVGELASLRSRLGRELGAMGLTAAAAGTHPLTMWEETELSGARRYRALGDSMRVLVRREPTMALHVHVGVPSPEDAIRVLNGLRPRIPVLLALSGNSPFWQGRDSGFASARTLLFQAFPRTGLPRRFAGYADYVEAVDALIASGAVPDPSFLWWDVRLQPALGTVEVRVMDAQSSVREIAPVLALIQSLARLVLEEDTSPATPAAEVLAENRFLAARDGMDARLIDPGARSLVPVRETLGVLLDDCRPHAHALGCAWALDRVRWLAAAVGADRQRAVAARLGTLEHLVASLAERFLAADWLPATAGQTT